MNDAVRQSAGNGVKNVLVVPLAPATVGFKVGSHFRESDGNRPGQLPLCGVPIVADDLSNRAWVELKNSNAISLCYSLDSGDCQHEAYVLSYLREAVLLDYERFRPFLADHPEDNFLDSQ